MKGPTDQTAPPVPQAPGSPVTGAQPMGPAPAQRTVAPVQGVQIRLEGFDRVQSEVSGSLTN